MSIHHGPAVVGDAVAVAGSFLWLSDIHVVIGTTASTLSILYILWRVWREIKEGE